MPRLPTAPDYGGADAPRLTRAVSEVDPRAYELQGRTIQGIADVIEKETQRIEDLAAEDALNKLQERRVNLTLGENGFTKKRAGDVVNEPVLDNFSKEFEAARKELEGSLSSPRARQRFAQRAAGVTNGYRMDLIRHVSSQTEEYQKVVFESTMQNGARNIALHADDQTAVNAEIARLRTSVADQLGRMGISDATPENAKIAQAFSQEQLGGALTAAVGMLIAEDRIGEAEALYNSHKDSDVFTAQQIATIQPKLKAGQDWRGGSALGAKAYGMLQQGMGAEEVELVMTREAKSSSELTAARLTYGRLVGARNQQWQEVEREAVQEMVNLSDGTNTSATWLQVRSKYIGSMNPETVLNLDKAAEADTVGGTSRKTDPEEYGRLLNLANGNQQEQAEFLGLNLAGNGRLSITDIKSFQIMQVALRTQKGEGSRTVLKEEAKAAGETAFGVSKNGKNKTGQLVGWVTQEAERVQEQEGLKGLTLDQRRAIISKGLEPVEYTGKGFFGGPTKKQLPRYEYDFLRERGMLEEYVPDTPSESGTIAPKVSVPTRVRGEIVREFRAAKGRAPTEDEIIQLFTDIYQPAMK